MLCTKQTRGTLLENQIEFEVPVEKKTVEKISFGEALNEIRLVFFGLKTQIITAFIH